MSGIGSQDFQNLSLAVQDLVRAMRENTEGTKKATQGTGPGGPPASGGGAQLGGGSPSPQEADAGRGFSLSSMNKIFTAAGSGSPAASAIGSLVAGGISGGPLGLATAAVGLVGQEVARQDQEMSNAAMARLGPIANPGHLTPFQAELRGYQAEQRTHANDYIRRQTDLAYGRGGTLESLLDTDSAATHLANARHAAEVQGQSERRLSDALDPRLRARARLEQRLGRAMQLGDFEHNGPAQDHAERLYRYFLRQEQRHTANEHVLDRILDKVDASRAGIQRGGAHQ